MPRISEITDDGDDPTLKPIFDRQRQLFGDIMNPAKVMAHCPPILRAAGAMGLAFEQSGQAFGAREPGRPQAAAQRLERAAGDERP